MNFDELWEDLLEGKNCPFVIAEIGVNHENSMRTAMEMIEAARAAGAHAVKFQTYKAEKIASRQSPAYWDLSKESTPSQYALFKKHDAFGAPEFAGLAEHCRRTGIIFLSTPFDFEAADFLYPLMPAFKISSSDITNRPFIEHIARKNKPVMLSTGASQPEEIREAVSWVKSAGNTRICVMHCVLSYPTAYENANLGMITHLRKEFPDCLTGYSDHTPADENMLVLTGAALLGARIIEKHFTLNKNLPGNDHYHAMDPRDLKKFTENLAMLKKITGSSYKRALECEAAARKYARRSLVAAADIEAGQAITPEMLTQKRPGTGISPAEISSVLGRKTKTAIPEDTVITWEMLD